VYPGNYEDYLWRKQGGPETLAMQTAPTAVEVATPAPAEPKKRVNPIKLKKLQDRLKEVEQQVASLESEIAQTEAALADFKSVEETMRLNDIVTTRRTELASRVAEWEELSAEIEA
jgi:ATP-binding cassette subfamily F protein 3